MKPWRALRSRFRRFDLPEDDVVRHAVRITVWGRWFVMLVAGFLLAYRPDFWYPENMGLAFLQVPILVINGVVHHRLRTNRPVSWRWMLLLSVADVTLITANVVINGKFDTLIFLAYYPALAAFALIFTSLWLNLAWGTLTAAAYTAVSLGYGLDLAAADEKALLARVAAMYVIAVGICLIVRFERGGRQSALARERRAHQQRTDLSQAIHDNMAQTAWMISLGIDGAMKLADGSNPRLTERLAATAQLSRSAMWELRKPIDMGHIFEGREIGRVLESHTASFGKIASVRSEFAQSGNEPPLADETKSGLFSIAHNALANAFLHAQADQVVVSLDFGIDRICLSVSDDGIGLPDDYAERGRGFGGMHAEARRLGGKLLVQTGAPNGGTTVSCMVPNGSTVKGD